MHMKIPLWAALVAGFPFVASGFTLDAVGYEGSELARNPPSIFLPGYGEVVFDAGTQDPIGVTPAYQNESGDGGSKPSFQPNQAVRILQVDSAAPEEVQDYTRQDFGMHTDPFNPRLAVTRDSRHLNEAGIQLTALKTQSIPETASGVLGLLGTVILIFLRRR